MEWGSRYIRTDPSSRAFSKMISSNEEPWSSRKIVFHSGLTAGVSVWSLVVTVSISVAKAISKELSINSQSKELLESSSGRLLQERLLSLRVRSKMIKSSQTKIVNRNSLWNHQMAKKKFLRGSMESHVRRKRPQILSRNKKNKFLTKWWAHHVRQPEKIVNLPQVQFKKTKHLLMMRFRWSSKQRKTQSWRRTLEKKGRLNQMQLKQKLQSRLSQCS